MKITILKEKEILNLFEQDQQQRKDYQEFVETHADQYEQAEKEKEKDHMMQRKILFSWFFAVVVIFIIVFAITSLNQIAWIDTMPKRILLSAVFSILLLAIMMVIAITMPSHYLKYLDKNQLMSEPGPEPVQKKDIYEAVKKWTDDVPMEDLKIYKELGGLSNLYREDGKILYFSFYNIVFWSAKYCGIDILNEIFYAPATDEMNPDAAKAVYAKVMAKEIEI